MSFKEKLSAKIKQLKTYLSAIYLAYQRKDTPLIAKIVAAITVGYALSPLDLIPDFIPVLGYLDDAVILPLLIWLSIKLIPQPILSECLEQSKDLWKDVKPKKLLYAVPIIIIWILIIAVIVRAIWF